MYIRYNERRNFLLKSYKYFLSDAEIYQITWKRIIRNEYRQYINFSFQPMFALHVKCEALLDTCSSLQAPLQEIQEHFISHDIHPALWIQGAWCGRRRIVANRRIRRISIAGGIFTPHALVRKCDACFLSYANISKIVE